MAEAVELKAWARQRSGKGGARSTRREGRIPGILYGDKKDPESIAVEYRAITQQFLTGHFQSTVFTLNVDGYKTRVIPRAVQLDPIRDFPIHVDFLRLSKDALVTVEVPVHFLNEAASPGLKRGGVLNVVRHEIQVRCPSKPVPPLGRTVSGAPLGAHHPGRRPRRKRTGTSTVTRASLLSRGDGHRWEIANRIELHCAGITRVL